MLSFLLYRNTKQFWKSNTLLLLKMYLSLKIYQASLNKIALLSINLIFLFLFSVSILLQSNPNNRVRSKQNNFEWNLAGFIRNTCLKKKKKKSSIRMEKAKFSQGWCLMMRGNSYTTFVRELFPHHWVRLSFKWYRLIDTSINF